jgi:hypothetical protein
VLARVGEAFDLGEPVEDLAPLEWLHAHGGLPMRRHF